MRLTVAPRRQAFKPRTRCQRVPEVKLPFLPEWRPLVLTGEKTTTIRTRRFGETGDTFTVDGERFELTRVESMSLAAARDRYHREEGFASPEAFEENWRRLHPTRGYQPAHSVWVHHFRRRL